MPDTNYFEWLHLNLNADAGQIKQALANRLDSLQQTNANQQQNQLQLQQNQQQLQIYTQANQTLNDEASRLQHRHEIEALTAQSNQQALNLTAPGPNNTPTNFACTLNPALLPTPKPGQFFSSWRPKDWNIEDSNGNKLPGDLQKQVVNRLSEIDNALYTKIAKDLGLNLSPPPSTNNQGLTNYTFANKPDANGNILPLSPAQQAGIQTSYNNNYNTVANSLAKPNDSFKVQLGPATPANQLQQQNQETPTDTNKSTAPTPLNTTLKPPGTVR